VLNIPEGQLWTFHNRTGELRISFFMTWRSNSTRQKRNDSVYFKLLQPTILRSWQLLSWSRKSLPFMEPEGLKPTLVPILSQMNPINMLTPYLRYILKLPSHLRPFRFPDYRFCMHFSFLQFTLRVSPISSSLIWSFWRFLVKNTNHKAHHCVTASRILSFLHYYIYLCNMLPPCKILR
jgi:hypothetical protein